MTTESTANQSIAGQPADRPPVHCDKWLIARTVSLYKQLLATNFALICIHLSLGRVVLCVAIRARYRFHAHQARSLAAMDATRLRRALTNVRARHQSTSTQFLILRLESSNVGRMRNTLLELNNMGARIMRIQAAFRILRTFSACDSRLKTFATRSCAIRKRLRSEGGREGAWLAYCDPRARTHSASDCWRRNRA